mgnify:CR=1 FL=1
MDSEGGSWILREGVGFGGRESDLEEDGSRCTRSPLLPLPLEVSYTMHRFIPSYM